MNNEKYDVIDILRKQDERIKLLERILSKELDKIKQDKKKINKEIFRLIKLKDDCNSTYDPQSKTINNKQ